MAPSARGGLQFMLIIWLQGIWLPLHGYNYAGTPLWAGIYMLPLTAGFLIAGPVSGLLSDRYGAAAVRHRRAARRGGRFIGLMLLPVDFPYWLFALLIFFNGIGSGLFAAPNTTAIMSSVPADQRGAASGMRSTFQNSGMSLSIGIFFSLMIAGLASTLPHDADRRPAGPGRARRGGQHASHLPPVSTLFAAFLGLQPDRAACSARPARCTSCPPQRRGADRPAVLPAPDLGAVPPRPDRRLHRGDRDVGGGRPDLGVARQAVLLRRPGRRRASRDGWWRCGARDCWAKGPQRRDAGNRERLDCQRRDRQPRSGNGSTTRRAANGAANSVSKRSAQQRAVTAQRLTAARLGGAAATPARQ